MSSFGTISLRDDPLAIRVWWPASRRPSPSGAGPRRTGRLDPRRDVVDGTFVLGFALLGFPFPDAIRRHTVGSDMR